MLINAATKEVAVKMTSKHGSMLSDSSFISSPNKGEIVIPKNWHAVTMPYPVPIASLSTTLGTDA